MQKCPIPVVVEIIGDDVTSYVTVPKPTVFGLESTCVGYSPHEQLWALTTFRKIITTATSLEALIERVIAGNELEPTRFYTRTETSYIEIQHNTNANAGLHTIGNWGEGYITQIEDNEITYQFVDQSCIDHLKQGLNS